MNLAINTRYNPFSLQELITPLTAATQYHQEVDNVYANMDIEASKLQSALNRATDTKEIATLQSYLDSIRNSIDRLNNEGLSPSLRNNLNKLRSTYNTQIIPISNAHQYRLAQIAQQAQERAKDPTIMHSYNASNRSLSDFINNPLMMYESQSGATLSGQAAEMARHLTKEIREGDEDTWRQVLGGQAYERIIKTGVSFDDVMAFIRGGTINDPRVHDRLKGITETIENTNNIFKWDNFEDFSEKVYDYIGQGLLHATGEEKIDKADNKDYLNPLQELQYERARLELDELKNKINGGGDEKLDRPDQSKLGNLSPYSIYSRQELTESQKATRSFMEDYSKYFIQDSNGDYKLTQEGRNELFKKTTYVVSAGSGYPSNSTFKTANSDFREDAVKFLRNEGRKDNITVKDIEDLFTRMNKHPEQYRGLDAKRVQALNYNLGPGNMDVLVNALSYMPSSEIVTYDYDPKTNRFKEDDTIDKAELLKKENGDYVFHPSGLLVHGTSDSSSADIMFRVSNKNGDVYYIRAPKSINEQKYEDLGRLAQTKAIHDTIKVNFEKYLSDPNSSEAKKTKRYIVGQLASHGAMSEQEFKDNVNTYNKYPLDILIKSYLQSGVAEALTQGIDQGLSDMYRLKDIKTDNI